MKPDGRKIHSAATMPEMMEKSLAEPDARERDTIDSKSMDGPAKNVLQPPDKAMDHAWRYFALHAQQRMSVFNFFVVLSGILSTGIAASLQGGKPTLVTATLGALLAVFAFVFRRLDRRGAQFVKLAEDALIASEACCMPDNARVFGLVLQLHFMKVSESMGNHDSNIVDACCVD